MEGWRVGKIRHRHIWWLALLLAVAVFSIAEAAGVLHLRVISHPKFVPAELPVVWALPFAGLLVSIAFVPLVLPTFWRQHYGKAALLWGAAFLVPFSFHFGTGAATLEFMHVFLADYMPFMIMLGALYVVGGGIRFVGYLRANPVSNAGMLVLGTLAAGVMGTTGASMLFIRPILDANAHRKHKAHVVVFFIFLVSNIGGALSPLGDPPLFMGFLRGVSFFWPTVFLMKPFLVASGLLLLVFIVLDFWFWRQEGHAPEDMHFFTGKLGIEGKINILLLLAIVGFVMMPGLWRSGITISTGHTELAVEYVVSDLMLVAVGLFSWSLTPRIIRVRNDFHWEPMVEVATLFAAIFLTMVPVLAMLKAGSAGSFAVIDHLVTHDGEPQPAMFFVLTGALSSILDNTPTYLAFFNLAGGQADVLMCRFPKVLMAISCGAVFMGAMTYIGNAPNFMVRAIAGERGIKMPSFPGYMVWSILVLVPVFTLVGYVCF